jgi:hypothetical protein
MYTKRDKENRGKDRLVPKGTSVPFVYIVYPFFLNRSSTLQKLGQVRKTSTDLIIPILLQRGAQKAFPTALALLPLKLRVSAFVQTTTHNSCKMNLSISVIYSR